MPPGLEAFLWFFHRFTGLILITFLLLHIIGFAEFFHGYINSFLNSKVVVIVTVESLIFHMFNGIKILITDIWPFTNRKRLAIGVIVLLAIFSVIFFEVGL